MYLQLMDGYAEGMLSHEIEKAKLEEKLAGDYVVIGDAQFAEGHEDFLAFGQAERSRGMGKKKKAPSARDIRLQTLRDRIADLTEEVVRLENLPEEPPKRSVITFDKVFPGGYKEYNYAAIRAGDGLWYTTGPKSPKGYSWDELLAFIGDTRILVVTAAQEL